MLAHTLDDLGDGVWSHRGRGVRQFLPTNDVFPRVSRTAKMLSYPISSAIPRVPFCRVQNDLNRPSQYDSREIKHFYLDLNDMTEQEQ